MRVAIGTDRSKQTSDLCQPLARGCPKNGGRRASIVRSLTGAVESSAVPESAGAPAALVTGAASGIGRACAERFAAAGWRVVLVDQRDEELAALGRELGDSVATRSGSVTDAAVNEAAVAEALDRFGRLDAAVANAGVALAALVDDSTDEDFDRLFAVNVRAVMH